MTTRTFIVPVPDDKMDLVCQFILTGSMEAILLLRSNVLSVLLAVGSNRSRAIFFLVVAIVCSEKYSDEGPHLGDKEWRFKGCFSRPIW